MQTYSDSRAGALDLLRDQGVQVTGPAVFPDPFDHGLWWVVERAEAFAVRVRPAGVRKVDPALARRLLRVMGNAT